MYCYLICTDFSFFCRFQQIYMDGKMGLPFPINNFGVIGVAVFLLISGYYFQKSDGGFRFFLKRIKKLYPMYIISITLIFLVTHIFNLPQRTVTAKDYFLNYLFLGNIRGIEYVDGAHWYLRTILFVVIFFSAVQRLNNRRRILCYYLCFFV